jgi:hypothetical protein
MIPTKPGIVPRVRDRAFACASALLDDTRHEISIWFDSRPIPGNAPRTKKNTMARNRMLAEVHLDKYDYLLWIDADIVAYPLNMPWLLIEANPNGVSAPLVLMEHSVNFFDTGAFVKHGGYSTPPCTERRHMQRTYPYFPDGEHPEYVVEMDGVGAVTMVPTDIYKAGAKYEHNLDWTQHHSICRKAREMGRKVVACRHIVAFHANHTLYT